MDKTIRCPFCKKNDIDIEVSKGLMNVPFYFFKCKNKKCGAIVSFNNDQCNKHPELAILHYRQGVEK